MSARVSTKAGSEAESKSECSDFGRAERGRGGGVGQAVKSDGVRDGEEGQHSF